MSVAFEPQPILDFAGFVDKLVAKQGYRLNPCQEHCPYRGDEHAHLRSPGTGEDFITWADGRFSGYDLSLPARLLYAPVSVRNAAGEVLAYDMVLPKWPEPSDTWTPFRDRIPRASRCYRADAGFTVHVKPECRCPR